MKDKEGVVRKHSIMLGEIEGPLLPTILLVEDSQTTKALFSKYLSGTYRVVFARDGAEAWEILTSDKQVALVLSDINMPRMTGHQLLIKIRKCADLDIADLPVVLMTTTDDNVDRNLAFLNGANDFITKPVDEMELLGRINVHYKLGSAIRARTAKENRFIGAIKRSIEFSPADKQAGMAILSYFTEVLRQKYPDVDTKVTIEQEERFVRMIIETPDGEKDRIEQTLEQYGLVVQGKMKPEELVSDPIAVMNLKNKLELSALELRQTREILRLAETNSVGRIAALEKQVNMLHSIVGEGLKNSNTASRMLEKMLDEHLGLSSAVRDSLDVLVRKIDRGIRESDEAEVKAALSTVKAQSPSLLSEIQNFARGSLHGAGGNLLSSWIVAIGSMVPRI